MMSKKKKNQFNVKIVIAVTLALSFCLVIKLKMEAKTIQFNMINIEQKNSINSKYLFY